MSQICPLCAIDDYVIATPLGPGFFEYECRRTEKHPDGRPWVWRGATGGTFPSPAGEGPIPIADVRQALLECVHEGDPWVEYGIVEARYAEAAEQDFEILREEYGHRNLGPKLSPNFTVSAYLGRALGDLRESGQLAHRTGKATGIWAYNGTISYWAKPPPGPPESSTLTFASYSSSPHP